MESTDRHKIQGRYVLCLINPVFDYDNQLYRFYQIQNKVNMDLLCCFVGASDRELKQITNKLKVLNEITMLRDTSKQGAIILKKAGTNLRYYMINKENQIYNTADDAGMLEDLIRNEFGEHYYDQTEQGAYIEATNPQCLIYEGRIYRYLNNHVIPTAKVHRHVTVAFVTLQPVTKISNYDEFKQQLRTLQEMERNYPENAIVLVVLGMDEDNVRKIDKLTGMLKKVQVALDNNTKIEKVWRKINTQPGNFVMEIHNFDENLMPVLEPTTLRSTERVFTKVDEAELFLHDYDFKLTDAMPNVPEPVRNKKPAVEEAPQPEPQVDGIEALDKVEQ